MEQIYQAYPIKVGKTAAKKAIDKVLKDLRSRHEVPPEGWPAWLLGRTTKYAAARRTVPGDDQWIPYPATWFYQGRYDDDEREWTRRRGPASGPKLAREKGQFAEPDLGIKTFNPTTGVVTEQPALDAQGE